MDLDFVKQYSDFSYEYFESPNRIVVTNEWGNYTIATASRNTYVRLKGGIKSPILEDLADKDEVTIIEAGDNWTKVLTADGVIGYVQERNFPHLLKTRTSDYTPDTFAHIQKISKYVWPGIR